jgi:acetyltransferase-like isoleucine patch superfamily enzyme
MRPLRRRSSRDRERAIRWAYSLVAWVPGRIGMYLRRFVVQCGAHEVGSGLCLDTGIRITGWGNISIGNNLRVLRLSALHAHNGKLRIGNNVSINVNSCINPADGGHVEIADDVLIAQNVVIRASDHRHDAIDRPINQQGHTGGEIHIEEGAWIGANAVITRDVRIGAHSIVGAGSVVTGNVAPFTVVGGVPARLICQRVHQDKLPKPEWI